MRNSIWIGMLCVVGAAGAMVGCGDTEETNASDATGSSSASASGASSSTTTSSGSGGQGGAGGAGGAGGSGGGSNLINGCDPATAEDHTADAAVTINFGGMMLGASYSPACIRVSPGTDVTFAGTFMFHPLEAGTVSGGMATPDPTSPITATANGMSATFTIANQGDYPYYCATHYALMNMMGAIFVP